MLGARCPFGLEDLPCALPPMRPTLRLAKICPSLNLLGSQFVLSSLDHIRLIIAVGAPGHLRSAREGYKPILLSRAVHGIAEATAWRVQFGDGPGLHQFVPNPERGEAKVGGVADLQPAQPFEILSSSIDTTNIFHSYFNMISGGERCLMSIAMTSATSSS